MEQKQCPTCYNYVDMQDAAGYCSTCKIVIC